VEHLTFSAHTDAKGVLDLLHHVQPRAALLVHGETEKMRFLMARIQSALCIPCYAPATGESVHLALEPAVPLSLSAGCLQAAQHKRGLDLASQVFQVCVCCSRCFIPSYADDIPRSLALPVHL
jgi:hypothetical protein